MQTSVRLSVNIHTSVAEALQWLAKTKGTSVTDIIRDAVSTEEYVNRAHLRGAKILVKEPDGRTFEVLAR